jgi:hypothetical protein
MQDLTIKRADYAMLNKPISIRRRPGAATTHQADGPNKWLLFENCAVEWPLLKSYSGVVLAKFIRR